ISPLKMNTKIFFLAFILFFAFIATTMADKNADAGSDMFSRFRRQSDQKCRTKIPICLQFMCNRCCGKCDSADCVTAVCAACCG
uniref:Uncharacterized protein n=1 Tax=Panagrolaimus sp. ES5 TaxID=591445 RepID=A0AC34G002_9BILA